MLDKVKEIKVGPVTIGGNLPLVLIAGLCVIENEEDTLKVARSLKEIAGECDIPLIFKASYDKANRTSVKSYRGPGREEGLKILARVKKELDLPLLIDFHREEDADAVAEVADILQVPAFLCRQTDILLAAGRTGKAVNVKKGQFLSPENVSQIIGKIASSGNEKIMITERGSSFGYRHLINDMKSLPLMRRFGCPVIYDATHSTQLPGGEGEASGGESEYVPYLARAAVAAGCDGLFLEVHEDPEKALSDGPSVLRLTELAGLLKEVIEIDKIVKT